MPSETQHGDGCVTYVIDFTVMLSNSKEISGSGSEAVGVRFMLLTVQDYVQIMRKKTFRD